jgi:hypothetical protein
MVAGILRCRSISDPHDTLEIALELEPSAPGRDDFAIVGMNAGFIGGVLEISARRTDDLRNDDPFRAIDDEGAGIGHHRDIAHEDLIVFLDFAGLFIP